MGAIKSELYRLFHFVERFDEFSVVISANEIWEICERFAESILFRFFHRSILPLRNKKVDKDSCGDHCWGKFESYEVETPLSDKLSRRISLI